MLSDVNQEVIETYEGVRTDTEKIIEELRTYPYEKNFYYYMRSKKPRKHHTKAARVIYLNKTCWNGLYRVNSKGEFNVPMGRHVNPTICSSNALRRAARVLQRATLTCCDFEKPLSEAHSGDFAYLDPPFVAGRSNNGFLGYNSSIFSWEDQQRLSRVAKQLNNAGVFVLISNVDKRDVVELFEGFNYYRIRRRSLISGTANSRGYVYEALLSNYALFGIESEAIG